MKRATVAWRDRYEGVWGSIPWPPTDGGQLRRLAVGSSPYCGTGFPSVAAGAWLASGEGAAGATTGSERTRAATAPVRLLKYQISTNSNGMTSASAWNWMGESIVALLASNPCAYKGAATLPMNRTPKASLSSLAACGSILTVVEEKVWMESLVWLAKATAHSFRLSLSALTRAPNALSRRMGSAAPRGC